MNVVDTAILFATGGRRKHSLKRLAACLLNKQIQENSLLGHCSGEDAATALILAVQRAVLGNTFMIQDNGEINCSDEATFYSADIVLCTLNSSGSAWLRRNSGPRSTFFLDEGGQCNESDFYLATTYPRVRRIVVMGDPMQLPPTVINTDCKNAGFGRSWMANIQFLRPDLVHLLDTQYRMDPAILKFPNKHFYKSRIKSGDCVRFRLPEVKNPVGFIDTSNRSSEEREVFSWKNPQEASIIRALLRQDEDIQSLLENQFTKVVVITPYAAQIAVLKDELRKVKGLVNWAVSTVDSFQGQEADIIIISTVRTERIGFIDDRQRLNVALTRAKRLIRIVGCKKLFEKLHHSSILRQLTTYLQHNNFLMGVDVQNIVFSLPDWRKPSKWTATLTQRFHNCVKPMTMKQKAVALTTLQHVTIPNLRLLSERPRSNSTWQLSFLRGHSNCSIVWVAKGGGSIEAHFAGSRKKCLTFIQKNISNLPRGSCRVRSDLSGVIENTHGETCSLNATSSWSLSNFIQIAIQENTISVLPEGSFRLDPEQQLIADSPPPLLIESRSGTGKTNVLFQHALAMSHDLAEDTDAMPIGFITVSKLLRSQLEQMYREMKGITNVSLQSCVFMSLSDLLDGLAKRTDVGWSLNDAVTFQEFLVERKSYSSLSVDRNLVENEIGGVILGSLKSAELRRPLTNEEYKVDLRSNISNTDERGSSARQNVYNQFESYQRWKKEKNRFDINDFVLEILKKLGNQQCQLFSGVYLDEVQDFSYAMIYLICSLGGTPTMSWVFAGDTAQMISPGCSFKFAGLKQTLLSIQPGIESKLKKVDHLLVNYRTTKHILDVGNAILSIAKEYFPGAIEFARKERAVHDFGLPVVTCDWDEAMATLPSFGKDQALVYSFSKKEEQSSIIALQNWLGRHPFILSVLDSKGLEFDDVVIAFDLERAAWKVEDTGETVALSMLREMYVAVTRAKRRVVILVKHRSDTMMKFLSELKCGLVHHSNSTELINEFNTSTSEEQWMHRANGLFKEERFDVASRCYEKANSSSMGSWSQGKHCAQKKDKKQSRYHYLQASLIFYEHSNYRQVLDVAKDLLEVVSWNDNPPQFIEDKMFIESMTKYPNQLSHGCRLQIDIFLDRWDNVALEDIERHNTMVNKRRTFEGLKRFLGALSICDLNRMIKSIPCVVGDLYFDQEQYLNATAAFQSGGDFNKAEDSSEAFLNFWLPDSHHLDKQGASRSISLLQNLQNDPERTARTKATQCVKILGHRVIKIVCEHKSVDPTLLHLFCKTSFHNEVLAQLKIENKENLIDVVHWFISHDDKEHAAAFISDRISQWKNSDLVDFVFKGLLRTGVAEEYCRRGMHFDAATIFLDCKEYDRAFVAANLATLSRKGAETCAFKLVKKIKYVRLPSKVPQRITLLWRLFYEPEKLDKKCCNECVNDFGVSVIQEFVLRSAPHCTKVKNEDGTTVEIYLDVIDLLSRFGRSANMPLHAVLKRLHQYKISADTFIDFHMKSWSVKELFDIDKMRHQAKYVKVLVNIRGITLPLVIPFSN